MKNDKNLKIDIGTISFWTKANSLKFNDGKTTPVFSVNPEGGSIFMVKDDDNKLKVFYVVMGQGRADLEYDVSNLDPKEKHMIVFTWNLNSKELILYIDGKEVVKKVIDF